MTDGTLLGSLFVLSGFGLLLGQIITQDALNTLTVIQRGVEQAFSHDSFIFPDHQP